MNTTGKAKRKFEKFINTSNNSRENNKNKDFNKLNISNISKENKSYNNTEKRRYQFEYSNSKKDDINLNLIKNDEEEKNILLGLIKEGLISIDEPNENEIKNNTAYDIDNIKINEFDLEKIMKKILFLNKSLKNAQMEKYKLKNEENVFLNAIDKDNLNKNINNIGKNENENNINIIINKESSNKNDLEILKKYEHDLNYITELIKTNNDYNEFK